MSPSDPSLNAVEASGAPGGSSAAGRSGGGGGSGGSRGDDPNDSLIGRLAIDRGLASSDDVKAAKTVRRLDSSKSLGVVLVEQGVITRSQLDRLRPELDDRGGKQIPGYHVIKKLGAGAMAQVFKARQLSLDRIVAIKVLPQKFTSNADFVERFYAEGKAAAKLNHPNIVQAYDVGKAGEYHYFVMEFVDGRTVFDDISGKGPYREDAAVRIAIEVANALKHSHERGFIHRDVKPKNIMIEDDTGRAKLADMGLARAVNDREAAELEAGKAYGTPYYISPEQIRGEVDVDFRADIYSLGATLYHMITGQVPFDGPNPSAVMRKHLSEELTPPDHLNPQLSSGIGEVVEVCLNKDRNKRYNSTGDLLEDLQAIERGEAPIQARKVFDINSLSALDSATRQPQAQPEVVDAPVTDADLQRWRLIAMMGWGFGFLCFLAILIIILAS